VYYHSFYKKGEDNMEACVRCHRRLIALVPKDLEPRRQLDLWRPGGVALAYPHLGLENEVFAQLDALREAIAGQWSVYDHFSYTLAYQNQYRELEQWDRQVEEGQAFVEWASTLPTNDPRLFMEPLSLEEDTEGPEKEKVGEWVRCWTLCYLLKEIARAQRLGGMEMAGTFAALEKALVRHEAHCLEVERQTEEPRRTAAAWRTTSLPATRAVPESASKSVQRILIAVVFPAPFRPSKE